MIAATLISSAASLKQANDQKKAAEDANSTNSAQAKMDDVASTRRDVKNARVARAKLLQSSQASGTTGSSGESGGLSGLQTQLGANIGRRTGQANTANALGDINQKLADDSMFNAGISAVGSVVGAYGQYKG